MVLTVRYEADELIARFLMGEREEDTDDDLPVCSAQSPLGTALRGAKAGDRRTLSVPGGDVVTVTLVSAVPYRPDRRADRDERSFARRRLSSPQRSDCSGSSGGFHDPSRRSA